MQDSSEYLENYRRIVRLLGSTFRNMGIEILLHDLVNPSPSITCIAGGEVTGRSDGMGTTKLVIDLKRRRALNQDKLNYGLAIGARRFKCTTVPILREPHGIVGADLHEHRHQLHSRPRARLAGGDRRSSSRRYCATDMRLRREHPEPAGVRPGARRQAALARPARQRTPIAGHEQRVLRSAQAARPQGRTTVTTYVDGQDRGGNEHMAIDSVVKSAGRTLRVLELFAAERTPLGAAEISRRLAWPKSSTNVLLRSLASLGYLTVDPGSIEYFPSPKVAASLGEWIPDTLVTGDDIPRRLEELNDRTGETVTLSMQNGFDMQFVTVLPGTFPISLNVNERIPAPIFSTAIGIALLATEPDDTIRRLAQR